MSQEIQKTVYIIKYTIPEVKMIHQINHSGIATVASYNMEKATKILASEGQFKDSGTYEITYIMEIPNVVYTGPEGIIDETYLSFEDEK